MGRMFAAQPWTTPPYNPDPSQRPPVTIDGTLPGPMPTTAPAPSLPDLATVAPRRLMAERIIGGFGDFATRMAASLGDPVAANTLQSRELDRRTAQAAQLQAMQRVWQRDDAYDVWERQQRFKLTHPDDDFTQYMQAAGIDPRSPQGQALYRQRAESMAAPPLMAVDGFDAQGNPTKTFMPRTGLAGGSAAPAASGVPDGAVAHLRAHPDLAGAFDAKYGAGASARYLGGAAPQASTPFAIR